MILVVCPNLAVDVTLEVDALSTGAVHRARSSRRQAGGKGVNVARALRSLGPLGAKPVMLGFAGGGNGREIADELAREGLHSELVPFDGENRTCTILLAADGTATVVNEIGPEIEDASGLVAGFESLVPEAEAVALMGSLPPRLPQDTYADLVARARRRDLFCLLDSSGEALRLGLAAGPSVAKPNRAEAEALLGRKLETGRAQREAVSAIRSLGAELAILTLGADGFLVGSENALLRSRPLPSSDLRLGNPTGAGDALAAGFLAGVVRGYSLPECARLGAAAATASLAEGYGRFRAKDVRVEAAPLEII